MWEGILFSRPLDFTTHTHAHAHRKHNLYSFMPREQIKTHSVAPRRTDTHNMIFTKTLLPDTTASQTHTHTPKNTPCLSTALQRALRAPTHPTMCTHTQNNFLWKYTQIQIKRKSNASTHGQRHSFCLLTPRLYISVYLTECHVSLSPCLWLSSLMGSPHKTQLGFCSSPHRFTFSPPFCLSYRHPSSRCYDDILL